jgi:hypothetical protein
MPTPPKRAKRLAAKRKGSKKGNTQTKKAKPSPTPVRAAATAASIAIEKQASDDDKMDGEFCPFDEAAQRVHIAMVWQFHFDGLPQKFWQGRDGVVSKICAHVKFLTTKSAERVFGVLTECAKCILNKVEYTGGRRGGSGNNKPIIETGSFYMQMVADCMEEGLGLHTTMNRVNKHRVDAGLLHVGQSAIASAYHRACPVCQMVTRVKSGSHDPKDDWSRARFRWVTQLLIRLGEKEFTFEELKADGVLEADELDAGVLPNCFNKDKLSCFTLHQLAGWDETHKKIRFGTTASLGPNKGLCVRFARDENGKLDPNGALAPLEKELKVKFPGECRLCLGCYVNLGADGKHTGERLPPYVYTECTLLTLPKYEAKIQEEIRRVKNLAEGYNWVDNRRDKDEIFRADSVTKLKGCGATAAKHLAETYGIKKVGDLLERTIKPFTRVQQPMINNWMQVAGAAKAKFNERQVKDHKKEENPYESKYGASWRDTIAEVTGMKHFRPITELITHVFEESKRAMGPNYLVWHDALSLMTCDTTRTWMEEKGYLEHWVLPELGLNRYWKYYKDNPTGNGPELHWMDNSLNRDSDVAASAHCAETNMLREGDALFGNKFRMDTPGELTRTYMRVWNGDANGAAPSGARIVHDIENWVDVLHRIFDAKGIAVDDRREGRRRATSEGPTSSNWGGKRTKGAYEPGRWLHEDAAAVSGLMASRSEERYNGQ